MGITNFDELLNNEYYKIVLSNPLKISNYKKIVIKLLDNAKTKYQAEQYTETQVVHTNLNEIKDFIVQNAQFFKEIYCFGEVSYSSFLKKWQYYIMQENKV